jgi:cation diffusion facilitator family transporter
MSAQHGTKAIVAAFLANAGIAVAKFVAYLFTGSSSMLAESVHSLADAGNQGLLLYGGRRARQEASELHPFGYGRARYFWSFVVALVLFSLGGLFSLYEGWHKLSDPHAIEAPIWAFAVLGIAIVLEGLSFLTAVRESNALRGKRSWAAFVRHAKSPELPVVLLEDVGALIGLVLALVGVALAVVTGDPRWDAIGTLSIGVLLVAIAIVLSIEMKSLLLGEAADPAQVEEIRAALEGHPRIERLIHLRTQHQGPEELLVAAKLGFDPRLDLASLARVIDEIEVEVRRRVPIAKYVFLEPDVYREPGAEDGADAPARDS